MATKLTELLREAIAKADTPEGRRELAEERKRRDAEAQCKTQEAYQGPPAPVEAPEAVQELAEVPERPDATAQRRTSTWSPTACRPRTAAPRASAGPS